MTSSSRRCSVCRTLKKEEVFLRPTGKDFYKSCDLCRGRSKRWYHSNRDRHAKSASAWRKSHPKEMMAYFQRWKSKPGNAEKHVGWVRTWMRAHPELMAGYYKRWYAKSSLILRKLSLTRQAKYASSTFTFDQWLNILEVFDHCCAYCLRKDQKLTMDHVIPVSKEGEHTEENIVPACKSCNSRKNDRLIFTMLSSRHLREISA